MVDCEVFYFSFWKCDSLEERAWDFTIGWVLVVHQKALTLFDIDYQITAAFGKMLSELNILLCSVL